ncbi:MAG TPA: hypothetical protein PK950_03340 [Candidatus Paceibacterota bacterium]|nr:hypothetical protein [Candidatus Paceibacterota bacterium]
MTTSASLNISANFELNSLAIGFNIVWAIMTLGFLINSITSKYEKLNYCAVAILLIEILILFFAPVGKLPLIWNAAAVLSFIPILGLLEIGTRKREYSKL